MREVVFLGGARTPFGNFLGSLATVPAPRLGATAMEAALKKSGVAPDQVSEVIMGNVLSAGVGQAPARQAMIYAGIPDSVPAMTINKVCGSGMKAIMIGAQAIMTGDSDVVVAGGMENMSLAPYASPGARTGLRMGEQALVDLMIHDGLWDPYDNRHMGSCGDLLAKKKDISRAQQDELAAESFRRAQAAQKAGKLAEQIVPVTITGRKGEVTVVDQDEGPAKVKFDKIPQLRPAFGKDGTVTAANASPINDGAGAVVIASAQKAEELGLKPQARLVSYAQHSHEPELFTTAPIPAMRKALEKASWSVEDVDLFEVNEAFAVVALTVQRDLGIPNEKLNVWGGAIALGHPIGASGVRIVITLLSALKDRGLRRGCAGICIGGGEATAVCIERVGD